MPRSRVRVPLSPPKMKGPARARTIASAGPQRAHLLQSVDERLDFGCRVVRCDVTRLVAQEQLAILESDAGGSQSMTVREFAGNPQTRRRTDELCADESRNIERTNLPRIRGAHHPAFFARNCETDHPTRSARKAASGAILRSMLARSRA
jgi:hypothetical protein